MKTLYITRSSNILVDTENNTANKLDTCRNAVNSIFLAKEPMHVVYGEGEYSRELDVEEGDLIITFYENNFKYKVIAVKNTDWIENITEYEKYLQEEKERWAKNKQNTCEDCCKCICDN